MFSVGSNAHKSSNGHSRRRFLSAVGVAGSIALVASGCGGGGGDASDYLKRPLELYVPASAGGGTDASARVITKHLEEKFDATVSVVNETGGGGALAVNEVAQSGPDGHTLLYFHEAMIVGQAEGTVKQSALDDFTPLGSPSRTNQYLLAPADSGWDDLDDFKATAQKDPGAIQMAVNFGQTSHYVGAMFENEADVELKLVDAGSESDRVNELLGGRLDVIIGSNTVAKQYVESGDMVALAVLSDEPDPAFEEVPTAIEQGYDIDFPLNFMLFAPKNVEPGVVDEWDSMLAEIAEDPKYVEEMSKVAQPTGLSSDEVTSLLEEEVPKIQEISKHVGDEG